MPTRLTYKRQLYVLLLNIFIGSVGSGILNPLVPQLFSSSHALFPGLGYGVYGLLVAVYPFCQFCSSFVLGGVSDHLGRKRMLLLSLGGTVAGYLLLIVGLLTRNLPLVFLARALDGITGGSIGITQAAIADITPKEVRNSRLGLIGGAFGFGLVVGPLLGGTLAVHFSIATPFAAAAAIAALNALLIGRYLPRDGRAAQHTGAMIGKELFGKLGMYVKNVRLRSVLTTSLFYSSSMACLNTFFPVFLIERFGFGVSQIGLVYAYIGIMYAANQFLVLPHINRRWRAEVLLPAGIVVLGAVMVGYALAPLIPILLVLELVFIVANGTNQSNMVGLLSTSSGADEQGKILGLNSSLVALAQTITPPFAGLVATGFTGGLPMLISAGLMFVAASMVLPLARGTIS